MAGIVSPLNPSLNFKNRVHGIRCCSSVPDTDQSRIRNTPKLLKFAVTAVTELLRFINPQTDRSEEVRYRDKDQISPTSIEDVIRILESDYENAYFVTGIFTSSIYAEDCTFEDPTIKFQGTELYARNLKLLVPFFESPSIGLKSIGKGEKSNGNFVVATWKLRTYLKFPWRPFISINGSTIYELDNKLKIIRHAESWNVSALEAIGQIFTPTFQGQDDSTQ